MDRDTEDRIKTAGLRRTRDRVRTLDHLLAADRPLAHGDLETALSRIDRVTLYRVLEALEAAGHLHRILGADGVWRYRAHRETGARCPGGHPHFLCLECGRMACLTDQPLPRVDVPPGTVVRRKQLVASGLCPACAATPDRED